MAGPKLDGAGIAKMATLDAATSQIQKIHGTVEQWALAVKKNQPTGLYAMQTKRALPGLATLLKAQFGLIADQVIAMNLAVTRGGGDVPRIRALREGVGLVKQGLEIAVMRTKAAHAVDD